MDITPKPQTVYVPDAERYTSSPVEYRRCGTRGLKLSSLTLGFWWNFGEIDTHASCRERVLHAFDKGITTFDLANNYGPPFGAAEETFGRIMARDLRPYRHEMVITTKAGHNMWHGPYGDGSSRKMLLTSIDESLERMGLDYVDIFYTHRYDPEVPIEETAQALVDIVRMGKAFYVGISKYPADKLRQMCDYLNAANVPCLVYQSKCNMLEDTLTADHRDILAADGMGFTAFSPLHQGILSDKYLHGIPADSRVGLGKYLKPGDVPQELVDRLVRLDQLARDRGETLSQLALTWLLSRPEMTSVIIGPRTIEQMRDCIGALDYPMLSHDEQAAIASILAR